MPHGHILPNLAPMGQCRVCGKDAGTGFSLCETCAQIPAPELPSEPPPAPDNTRLALLLALRSRSSYSALRRLIDLVTGLNLLLVGLVACYLIIKGITLAGGWITFAGFAVGLCGCFLVVASRQGALLLIDIADLLIEQSLARRESAAHSRP